MGAEQLPSDDEVHLWRMSLEAGPDELDRLKRTLSSDELTRAERFHFDKDRNHFSAGRGHLRRILGGYLDIPPAEVRFSYGAKGKPALADGQPSRLSFNVSHSHGVALFAVTRGRSVGVDIEYMRPGFVTDEIARRFFAEAEVRALDALPQDQRVEGFFLCWTRKEAYIKARGDGLAHSLDRFEVSLAPGQPAALIRTHDDPDEADRWDLRDVRPCEGYAAAVAAEGRGWSLMHCGW